MRRKPWSPCCTQRAAPRSPPAVWVQRASPAPRRTRESQRLCDDEGCSRQPRPDAAPPGRDANGAQPRRRSQAAGCDDGVCTGQLRQECLLGERIAPLRRAHLSASAYTSDAALLRLLPRRVGCPLAARCPGRSWARPASGARLWPCLRPAACVAAHRGRSSIGLWQPWPPCSSSSSNKTSSSSGAACAPGPPPPARPRLRARPRAEARASAAARPRMETRTAPVS